MRLPISQDVESVVERWNDDMLEHGFESNGVLLSGTVEWFTPDGELATASIDIASDARFPFAPPSVWITDIGYDMELTFHVERPQFGRQTGALCLWSADWPVDSAPWLSVVGLVNRVRGWLEATASGWPGDDTCDLERYLDRDEKFVLYNSEELSGVHGLVRTQQREAQTIYITNEVRKVFDPSSRRRHRKDNNLAYVADIGSVEKPLRNWQEISCALGEAGQQVCRMIQLGAVRLLLLQYSRESQKSVLAVTVKGTPKGVPIVLACESADESQAVRVIRGGFNFDRLSSLRVAIVGVGAIGSFLADLLARSGVKQFTLMDPEILRPGNVIRHLCGHGYVGWPKVIAVQHKLNALGVGVHSIECTRDRLVYLDRAAALLDDHDVVVDATANARVTSLLSVASQTNGRTTISVCVQRSGDVVRVDRFPAERGRSHLPPLESVNDTQAHREGGCGEFISTTSPAAVVAAAELACRYVIDQTLGTMTLPVSVADVRMVQTVAPFDELGRVAADVTSPGGVDELR